MVMRLDWKILLWVCFHSHSLNSIANSRGNECLRLYADSVADLKVKLNIAIEIRDNIDQLCTGSSYYTFLEKLVPVFMKLLEGPPVFMSLAWEHVR